MCVWVCGGDGDCRRRGQGGTPGRQGSWSARSGLGASTPRQGMVWQAAAAQGRRVCGSVPPVPQVLPGGATVPPHLVKLLCQAAHDHSGNLSGRSRRGELAAGLLQDR